eukprot:GAFH01001408.1.p1 GENE.GAFH01001408.1~~GAFH01001408.1.p1  ORF type:complete len:480 (-),score=205.07 GAFH01001408.1:202-1641(-)
MEDRIQALKDRNCVSETVAFYKQQVRTEHDSNAIELGLAILRHLFDSHQYDQLVTIVAELATVRSTKMKILGSLVDEAMKYLKVLPFELKVNLIKTLTAVTAGKMELENQHIQLVRVHAQTLEEHNQLKEAADILNELQIETVGALTAEERTLFVLEQLRVTLDAEQWILAPLLARKVNKSTLGDNQEKYYRLLIRLHQHEHSYLDIARDYLSIVTALRGPQPAPAAATAAPKEPHEATATATSAAPAPAPATAPKPVDKAAVLENLQLAALYGLLAPYDIEQNQLLIRLAQDETLQKEVPLLKMVVDVFLADEIIRWSSFAPAVQPAMMSTAVFAPQPDEAPAAATTTTAAATAQPPTSARWEEFHQRVTDHDIRVIAKFYDRIHIAHFAELLDLTPEVAEQALAKLVTDHVVFARIDRPKGLVTFTRERQPADVLNEWSNDLSGVLAKVERVTRLIEKERMVHKQETEAATSAAADQ